MHHKEISAEYVRYSDKERAQRIKYNANEDAQYVALLLKEEEMIEATRVVDPLKASVMDYELDKARKDPWNYLSELGPGYKPDMVIDMTARRLQDLKLVKETREKVENARELVEKERAICVSTKEQSHERLRKDSCNEEEITKIASAVTKAPPPPPPPPLPLTYTHIEDNWYWSFLQAKRKFKELEQKDKAADEHQVIRNILTDGWSTPVADQFARKNRRHQSRRLSSKLAYRPFDAASVQLKRDRDFLLKKAASRIRIIVTEH